MPDETFARRRELRPGLVPDEEAAAELSLQSPNPGADRRLGQVQPLGGIAEASGGDDREKRLGVGDIHGFSAKKLLITNSNIRLS
jgi:hypothetical protein